MAHRGKIWDVIVVGGGPSGLSAALVLARCRRAVLVCDDGRPRNKASRALHGFLTRDGTNPRELLRMAREELGRYPQAEFRHVSVEDAKKSADGFMAVLKDGRKEYSRKMVLATGMTDILPPIPDLSDFWGVSVWHCPYCDGWEVRDEPLAVHGHGETGVEFAVTVRQWTADLVLLTDGKGSVSTSLRETLNQHGIGLIEKPIAELVGDNGMLRRIVFSDGSSIERAGMFIHTDRKQTSNLPGKMCPLNDRGEVETGELEQSLDVPGLFVVGDASRDLKMAIVAAAEGAKAAFAINRELES